jgi:hypothetical protein
VCRRQKVPGNDWQEEAERVIGPQASDHPGASRMVRDRGLEPLTPSVSGKCSTTELTAPPAFDPPPGAWYRTSTEVWGTTAPCASRFCCSARPHAVTRALNTAHRLSRPLAAQNPSSRAPVAPQKGPLLVCPRACTPASGFAAAAPVLACGANAWGKDSASSAEVLMLSRAGSHRNSAAQRRSQEVQISCPDPARALPPTAQLLLAPEISSWHTLHRQRP